MPKQPLTDVGVRALKPPPQGQKTYWDTNSPLGVRVSQGGAKTFIVLTAPGQRRTIGRYPIIGLSDARAEAKRILAEKTLGVSKKPSAIKFETARTLFIESHYADKKPMVRKEATRLLTKHFSRFNARPLSEISDQEVSLELEKLRDRPSEQLHAFRAMRTFFRWCTRPPRRYLTHSPLEGYEAPSQDKKGTRTLSDRELAKIWEASEGQFGRMIKLLILWGVRRGELARIRPEWIERDVLTIPGQFTKNGRDHAIPLLPLATSILGERPNTVYFFSGRMERTHFHDGSWGKCKRQLDAKAGVSNWQIRDLRRTFRSNMPKLGVSRNIAELLINHVSGTRNELDEIYDRYDYLDEKRHALKLWEDTIRSLCLGAH